MTFRTKKVNKEKSRIKISAGHYKYKGYDIRNHGYYPSDRCVWWEAVNEYTGCADYHNTTLGGLIIDIDEYENKVNN